MRLTVLMLAILILAGCTKPAINRGITSNPNFGVDFLFENDGCKLYRFSDGGHIIYYANCKNGGSTTSWSEQSGKTTIARNVHTEN